MKTFRYLTIAVCVLLLTGCGLFRKYSADRTVPENLFGTDVPVSSDYAGKSFAHMSWRELFSDTLLQRLIDTALVRNADLYSARTRMKEAEALLKAARLGYLPTISFNPSLSLEPSPKFSYSVPLNLDWGVQGFGSVTNKLRENKALAFRAADNEQAVRSDLVAAVAKAYAHIQLMDKQLEILANTEEIWNKVLETQKALMENGRAYSTAVDQMKANLLNVQLQRVEARKSLNDMEASLCLLLGWTPGHIERSGWHSYALPPTLNVGLPADILENRPDVRAAGRNVEAAYYVTNQARAAMFPSLNLAGVVGWTGGGVRITDPGSIIYGAVASLTQPIFNQGKLRANLKVSKYRQEEAARLYAQTVLAAGNDVNKALRDCQTAADKDRIYKEQLKVLRSACDATEELMMNGKATYIEVLIAQKALLEAEQGEASNLYDGAVGVINLYASLGGGVN